MRDEENKIKAERLIEKKGKERNRFSEDRVKKRRNSRGRGVKSLCKSYENFNF